MVRLLAEGSRHVQAVADALGVTQPAVSRHARVLEKAGLVACERAGRRTVLHCPPEDASEPVRQLLAIAIGRAVGATGAPDARPTGDPDPHAAAASEPAARKEGGATPSPAPKRRPAVVSEELEDYLL